MPRPRAFDIDVLATLTGSETRHGLFQLRHIVQVLDPDTMPPGGLVRDLRAYHGKERDIRWLVDVLAGDIGRLSLATLERFVLADATEHVPKAGIRDIAIPGGLKGRRGDVVIRACKVESRDEES